MPCLQSAMTSMHQYSRNPTSPTAIPIKTIIACLELFLNVCGLVLSASTARRYARLFGGRYVIPSTSSASAVSCGCLRLKRSLGVFCNSAAVAYNVSEPPPAPAVPSNVSSSTEVEEPPLLLSAALFNEPPPWPTPPPPPARPLPPLLLLICPVHAQKLERGQSRANPQSKHSDSALNPKREGRTRNETSLASLPHAFTRAGLHTSSPSVFRYSHHHRPSYRASCWAPANAPRPATSTCF